MISFQCEYSLLKRKSTIGFILLAIASCADVAFAVLPVLSVSAASAVEYRPFNMTCETVSNKSYWFWNNATETYTIIGFSPTNQECIALGTRISTVDYFCKRNAVNKNSFTLSFKNVTRSQQNDTWKCGNQVDGIFSITITINVSDPTNKPVIQCTHNNTYKVIRNHPAALTCTVDGGNPAGSLQWECTGNVTEQHGTRNNDIVSKTITWNATQTTFCTCYSTNIAGTSWASVTTSILYPPVINRTEKETIIEGDSTILQCGAVHANPPVNIIRWTYDIHNVTNATSAISNVLRSDVNVYTCTAVNTMDPSCKDVVYGSTSSSIHMEVLYPPSVNISKGTSLEIKEGANVNYTCPVVHGNPPNTNVTWRRSNGTETWSYAALLILNVSRYYDSVYTCYASNVMKDSNGSIKRGNVSADIRLIVQFKTNVTYFYIRSYGHSTSVIVKENTSLVFECRLQSNPTADVEIFESSSIVNSSNANELLYNTHALCVGVPVYYRCRGNNFLNNEPSSRQVQLFVRCKPRADMNADVQFKVTSAMNQNVTLSYTALAYPYPSFEWYRNGYSITTRDSRFNISSTELQTNLTITNVEERDFGEYTLTVTNDVGSINESFQFKPNGVPEVPTDLIQDKSKTSDLVIALNWRSGFNNGSKQTFTIMYSKQTEQKWQSATVHDFGPTGTTIHYNVTELSSGTSYDIVVFAVNAKGRSKTNATLTCSTNLILEDTGHASIIGAAVGSTAGLLLIGVFMSGVVIYKRRFIKKPDSTIQPQKPVTYENLKIDQIPNESVERQGGRDNHRAFETNVDHTYEGLSRADSDPITTYENLKIQL